MIGLLFIICNCPETATDIVSSRTVRQVGLDVHVNFVLVCKTTVQTMRPVHFVAVNEPLRSRPTEPTVLNETQFVG